MVKVPPTDEGARHAADVCLHVGRIDCNCKRAMFDEVGSNLIFVDGDHTEVLYLGNDFGLVELAGVFSSSVRVIFLAL